MSYTRTDLTVIIPTLGRDLDLLRQVAARIDGEGVALRMVWDGHSPLTEQAQATLQGMAHRVEIIAHARNRGLSAARNSGARALATRLGMFIDDDIIPRQGFVDEVLAFHNQHADPLTMMMGCVSWRDTPYANPLTEWFETLGNWSVFHTAASGQPLSNFMGGFTAFKAQAFADIGFDERFTRYGCEDVEFGYRYFRQGGRLIYWPRVHGAHHKPLDLAAYRRDHVGAGHSRGILMQLHPDVAFDLGLVCRALLHSLPAEHQARLAESAEYFLAPAHAAQCAQETNALMHTLTDQAILSGLAEHLCAFSADFAAVRARVSKGETLSPEALIAAVDDFAPFLVLRAQHSDNQSTRQALLDRASALMPHYAQPYLLRAKLAAPGDSTHRHALADYLGQWQRSLDLRTERAVHAALGTAPATLQDVTTLSARDLFFRMEEAAQRGEADTVTTLAEAILTKDATYVGAYLAWARALSPAQSAMRRLLLRLAEHFVQGRPAHEQVQRRAEIQALATQAASSDTEYAQP